MAEVIRSVDEVTAEWLTRVLRHSGALTRGSVAAFDLDAGSGNWSTNATLNIRYEDGSQGARPPRLFLKMVNTDLGDGESFGPSEVTYYTRDYADVPDAPLIRCYDAAYSETEGRYHLLLNDLSKTHVTAARKTPTLDYGLALAEGLAVMHARWWGAERLAEAGAPIHDGAHIRRFVDIAEPGAGHILDALSAELAPGWPDLIRDLYGRHPAAIIDRTREANGFTLIHGDAGEYNILVPGEGDRPIYLIDRQPFDWSLTTWLGTYDLAYVMVLDWDVELRRRWEGPVLEQYHRTLLQHGVRDYPWDRLFDDYRLCVPMGVYIATEYCRGGINSQWQWAWMGMLRRALAACEDLDCAALWAGMT
jgi:hypothetical protein